jgi:hypothetical protein
MKQILITLTVFVFFYLSIAFVTLEIDFSKWVKEDRLLIITLTIISIILQIIKNIDDMSNNSKTNKHE